MLLGDFAALIEQKGEEMKIYKVNVLVPVCVNIGLQKENIR